MAPGWTETATTTIESTDDQQEAAAVEARSRSRPHWSMTATSDSRAQPADRVEAGQTSPTGPRPAPRRPDHRRGRADAAAPRPGCPCRSRHGDASPDGSKTIAIHTADASAASTSGTTRRVRPRPARVPSPARTRAATAGTTAPRPRATTGGAAAAAGPGPRSSSARSAISHQLVDVRRGGEDIGAQPVRARRARATAA